MTVDRIDPEETVELPLRAKSSRAVWAMLGALHATEEEGVDSALALGFEPDAQVLWIDEDGTIVVWPPPPINALVVMPGEPLHV